ncbi:hypothetical protein CBP31_09395 [Oceanisphaera profunda]|uniref:Uncharacterized protein n=1 Tax=Oceanisphaera profunda TaxID=1416627 RepID=A0A1Y0D6L9_9GAMM|nr:DUF1488 domain-containing protein [Oceanisphaera profunda]ART82816.1 hypothetical protein CBP31_09395 [Oceanisphaera profunda]
MNQDIIVNDDLNWQPEQQRLTFTAQWFGGQIICYLNLSQLEHLTGQVLVDEANIMLAFESVRFDIEEQVSELVGQEAFSPDGSLLL